MNWLCIVWDVQRAVHFFFGFLAFCQSDGQENLWFVPANDEKLLLYNLLGLLMGLAVFNNALIPPLFPSVLFKYLLHPGETYTAELEDLAQLYPDLGKGLQFLLDYRGDDFEELFDLTFEITVEDAPHAPAPVPEELPSNRAPHGRMTTYELVVG